MAENVKMAIFGNFSASGYNAYTKSDLRFEFSIIKLIRTPNMIHVLPFLAEI